MENGDSLLKKQNLFGYAAANISDKIHETGERFITKIKKILTTFDDLKTNTQSYFKTLKFAFSPRNPTLSTQAIEEVRRLYG